MRYNAHETAIIDEGARIGDGTRIWHFSHIMSSSIIGNNCTLGQNVFVASNVRIGNFVKIQNNVSIYEGVEIEDYVFCGPSMVFTNIVTPKCLYPQRGSDYYQKTLVRRGASIGANATIICGNTIGAHSMIGAGAVVTVNVPSHALMLGVPARMAGWVCECGSRLDETENGIFHCPLCGLKFTAADSVYGLSITKEQD